VHIGVLPLQRGHFVPLVRSAMLACHECPRLHSHQTFTLEPDKIWFGFIASFFA
jgi:hypothetical protein